MAIKQEFHIDVIGVLKDEENNFLVSRMRNDADCALKGSIHFLGDRCRKGEDPIDAIVRIFRDETSLEVTVDKMLPPRQRTGKHGENAKYVTMITFILSCEDTSQLSSDPESRLIEPGTHRFVSGRKVREVTEGVALERLHEQVLELLGSS